MIDAAIERGDLDDWLICMVWASIGTNSKWNCSQTLRSRRQYTNFLNA